MKRFLLLTLCSAFATSATLGVAQTDSTPLGDYARRTKGDTRPKTIVRVYDNDNLSAKTVTAPADAQPPRPDPLKPCNTPSGDQGQGATANPEESGEIKVGQSRAERQKAYAAWKDRISQKREQIDKLSRELDDLKTNAPQSVSVLHIWPDDVKYKMMLEEKQKGLDQAKAELDDLLEEARKAGVPSSFR